MRGCRTIFRKETANFFVSPIAYSVIAGFLMVCGILFTLSVLYMGVYSLKAANNPMISENINITEFVLRPLLQNMGFILLFLIPLLTMRLFAEEKKTGSIELLLTYPITDAGVLAGKFLAAMFVVAVMLGGTLPFIVILVGIGQPDPGTILSGYLGLLLLASAFVSLGIFISSLTENQIVAAAVSWGGVLLFWMVNWSSSLTDEHMAYVLRQMSIHEHLGSFTKGILSLSDISFFVLFAAFFLFLTLRSLETHRWRA